MTLTNRYIYIVDGGKNEKNEIKLTKGDELIKNNSIITKLLKMINLFSQL